MRWPTLFSLTLQGLLLSPSVADDRICRFPSGKITDDVPCTSDDNTFCCSPGSICLDNGYCYNIARQPFMLSRGTCTDRNWGKSCPQRCTGENNDWDRGSAIIFFEDNNGSPTYCCDALKWDSDNNAMGCIAGDEPFTLDAGKAMVGVAALKALVLDSTDDYYAGGINISQIAKSTSSSSDGNGNGTSSNNTTHATPTACASATILPGESGSGDNSGKEAAIGAGVGVPLGVIALASLMWAFWLQRQNRNLKKAAQAQGLEQGRFQGQMGYGSQSGMMMPGSGYMGHGQGTYGHQSRFVELGELEETPRELPGAK